MLAASYVPGPPLDAFVELFWLYRGRSAGKTHAVERVLPGGGVELVINLADDRLSCFESDGGKRVRYTGPLLSGPHSRPLWIDPDEQSWLLGVHCRPGGAHALLGVPAQELLNQHVPLEALAKFRANELRERMAESEEPGVLFRILERELLQRLQVASPDRAVLRGIELAGQCMGPLPQTRDLAADLGCSQRILIASFKKWTGYTPRLYFRLERFQRAVRRLAGDFRRDLAELALELGYYDQAHFNHEFREFSGLNPALYLRHRTEDFNHLAEPPAENPRA